ncbi:GrpB family protein [Arthrobacter sp. NPDC097144]|uniref:GrpB family protein n=1 Tax=Arthrobacter sp. NPDC097144 TaxID=3363946 RepID=UPI003806290B
MGAAVRRHRRGACGYPLRLPVESIEHVGSTSVPDLPAKPVLDIDIIVRPGIVTAAVRTLENAGYRLSVPGMAGTFDDCPGVKHAIHVK